MTKKERFNLFKKECLRWLDRFKIDDYGIRFGTETDSGSRAEIDLSQVESGVLYFHFNVDIEMTATQVKNSAKHEVIHALLADMTFWGSKRFASQSQLYEANERLVRKLQNIIS